MGDGGVERLFLAFAVSGTATGTVVGTLARPIAGTVAWVMVRTTLSIQDVARILIAGTVAGAMVGTTLSIQDVARIPIAGTVSGAMVGTVARTIIGGAIVCGGVNQFVVQKPLLQIGGLHTDLDRVAETEDLAGAAATDEVVLLVELEEV